MLRVPILQRAVLNPQGIEGDTVKISPTKIAPVEHIADKIASVENIADKDAAGNTNNYHRSKKLIL
jgi:hypothetical protein